VASLLIAILLWLVVHNLDRTPARFVVPIIYEHPDGVVVLNDRVNEVEVQVRATKPKLRTLQAAELVVRVRNPAARVGRTTMVLDANDVESPFGVVVERVTPSQFTVTYDARESREVPVQVELTGEPAPGFEVDDDQLSVSPAQVTLTGPRSLFTSRVVVRTEPIDLADRDASFTVPGVALLPPNPNLSVQGTQSVEVTVPLRAILLRRTFEDVPVAVVAGERRASQPNPRTIRVVVEGPEAQVRALQPAHVQARVDVSNLAPRAEDYRVEPVVTIDLATCPDCRLIVRNQTRVDVSVRDPAARGGGRTRGTAAGARG
jgi:YbbR domain-containing protein